MGEALDLAIRNCPIREQRRVALLAGVQKGGLYVEQGVLEHFPSIGTYLEMLNKAVKIDDGEYVIANGLRTTGWDWVEMANMDLTAGEHTLTITYREDGAKIDKLGFTTYIYGPEGMGNEAVNACE